MKAHLEPLVSIVRVLQDDQQFGDPYSWCATICRVERGCVEIMAAMRMPTPDEWHALRDVLESAGYDRVIARDGNGIIRTSLLAEREPGCPFNDSGCSVWKT